MDAIAKAAGISRSTLYRRFPNKDVLLSKVGELIAIETLQRLAIAVHNLPPRDAVVAAFVEYTRFVGDDPLVRHLLVEEPELADVMMGRSSRGADEFLERSTLTVASTLRQTGARMPDTDLELVAEHLVRIAFSLTQVRTSRLDLANPATIENYATKFLAPLVF